MSNPKGDTSDSIFDSIDLDDIKLNDPLANATDTLEGSMKDKPSDSDENLEGPKDDKPKEEKPNGGKEQHHSSNMGHVNTPLGTFGRDVIILWLVVIVLGIFGFQYWTSRTSVTDPVADIAKLEEQVENASSIGKIKSYVENYQTIVKHSNMNSDYKALIEMVNVPYGDKVSFEESQRITLSKLKQARLQIYNMEVDRKETGGDGFKIKF